MLNGMFDAVHILEKLRISIYEEECATTAMHWIFCDGAATLVRLNAE